MRSTIFRWTAISPAGEMRRGAWATAGPPMVVMRARAKIGRISLLCPIGCQSYPMPREIGNRIEFRDIQVKTHGRHSLAWHPPSVRQKEFAGGAATRPAAFAELPGSVGRGMAMGQFADFRHEEKVSSPAEETVRVVPLFRDVQIKTVEPALLAVLHG